MSPVVVDVGCALVAAVVVSSSEDDPLDEDESDDDDEGIGRHTPTSVGGSSGRTCKI